MEGLSDEDELKEGGVATVSRVEISDNAEQRAV
jgi:hypothetical protein